MSSIKTKNSLSKQEMNNLEYQIPLNRFAETNEIAEVVSFLVSQKNNYQPDKMLQLIQKNMTNRSVDIKKKPHKDNSKRNQDNEIQDNKNIDNENQDNEKVNKSNKNHNLNLKKYKN